MTLAMRENSVLFGSYICLDAMKRESNTFLSMQNISPSIGIYLKNL
jgi:hypothetical protein